MPLVLPVRIESNPSHFRENDLDHYATTAHKITSAFMLYYDICCRGIACVQQKYICVGTSDGTILVITPHKHSFVISERLETNGQAICAMTALDKVDAKTPVSCEKSSIVHGSIAEW